MSIAQHINELTSTLPATTKLIAVSKTKPVEAVLEAYEAGQRDFGENYIQELQEKQAQLPQDIRWHFIGHLQSNKVKYIAPYVHLIHGVDSLKLLTEINKQASKASRVIDVLLQIYIASEESKFGLSDEEAIAIVTSSELKELNNIRIIGLMGMASFTEDTTIITREFASLKALFEKINTMDAPDNVQLKELSMGMSSDYQLAVDQGSTMIRVGSSIFGSRNYNN